MSTKNHPDNLISTSLVPFESLVLSQINESTATTYTLHSALLHSIARQTALILDPSKDADGQREALVSIMLSAASVEAFISELGVLARILHSRQPRATLGQLAHTTKKLQLNALESYAMARFLLTHELTERGSDPFQSYKLLVDIRNTITHLKPTRVTGQAGPDSDLRSALRARGLQHADSTNLLHLMMHQSVATFACNTARSVILDIGNVFPFDEFADGHLLTIYPGDSAPEGTRLEALFRPLLGSTGSRTPT